MGIVETNTYNQASDEWGIDTGVASGVKAGNPAYSPLAGKIIGYVQSGTNWPPGRLLIQTQNGILGIGHIIPNGNLHVGDSVSPGDIVGQFTNVNENGPQGPMFEVMFAQGANASNINQAASVPRSSFITTPLPTLDQLAQGIISAGQGVTGNLNNPGLTGAYSTTGKYSTLNQEVQNAISQGGFGSSISGPIVGFFQWATQPFLLRRAGFTLAGLAMIFIGVRILTNRPAVPDIKLPDINLPQAPSQSNAATVGAKVIPVSQKSTGHDAEKRRADGGIPTRVEMGTGPSRVGLDEGPGVTAGNLPPSMADSKKPYKPKFKPPDVGTKRELPVAQPAVKKISRAKLKTAGYKP